MQIADRAGFLPTGHIRQVNQRTGEILVDQHNQILNSFFELVIRGLTGEDIIARVQALLTGVTGPGLITPGIRSLGAPVINVPVQTGGDLAPVKTLDSNGIRSICTWTALFAPTGTVVYDTIGLVSTTGLLVAATNFNPVTLGSGDVVAVQWTISLR
jgi:hypothetical protein